jgi:hypothetical protein
VSQGSKHSGLLLESALLGVEALKEADDDVGLVLWRWRGRAAFGYDWGWESTSGEVREVGGTLDDATHFRFHADVFVFRFKVVLVIF